MAHTYQLQKRHKDLREAHHLDTHLMQDKITDMKEEKQDTVVKEIFIEKEDNQIIYKQFYFSQ